MIPVIHLFPVQVLHTSFSTHCIPQKSTRFVVSVPSFSWLFPPFNFNIIIVIAYVKVIVPRRLRQRLQIMQWSIWMRASCAKWRKAAKQRKHVEVSRRYVKKQMLTYSHGKYRLLSRLSNKSPTRFLRETERKMASQNALQSTISQL